MRRRTNFKRSVKYYYFARYLTNVDQDAVGRIVKIVSLLPH